MTFAELQIIGALADLRTAAHLSALVQALALCVLLWVALMVRRGR